MNDEQEIIMCPRCKGAYFLQAKIWTPNAETLRINDTDNPLTLMCAHCGVCLQWIEGVFQWIQKSDQEGHEGVAHLDEDEELKKRTEEQWLKSRED